MTDLSYTVTRVLKEFMFLTPVWERWSSLLLSYKVSRHQVKSISLPWCDLLSHIQAPLLRGCCNSQRNSLGCGCSCKRSPPLKVLSKMTSEAPRKGRVFSQACKGFAEVTFLASCGTSSAEARAGSRVQFPMNDAPASAPRPTPHSILLLPGHCLPGNFGNKMGQIYQATPSLSHSPGSPAG